MWTAAFCREIGSPLSKDCTPNPEHCGGDGGCEASHLRRTCMPLHMHTDRQTDRDRKRQTETDTQIYTHYIYIEDISICNNCYVRVQDI